MVQPRSGHGGESYQWKLYSIDHLFQTIENESETAANCFATAQTIEATSPILPFATIPLAFE